MGITNIQWCRNSDGSQGFTYNPWRGCTKVSPACDGCYAHDFVTKRLKEDVWGPGKPRARAAASTLNGPLSWNRKAAQLGIRIRVFCASLADVFDNAVPAAWRHELWDMVRATPHLDWQLLTKRPENIRKMIPSDWETFCSRIWLGTTVEDNERRRRIDRILEIPAAVHFLSMEPLLEAVDIGPWIERLDWVIVGGESGPNARPMDLAWARAILHLCITNDVPVFMKQLSQADAGIYHTDYAMFPADVRVRQMPALDPVTALALAAVDARAQRERLS